ncbi:hypothetical protein FJV83_29395 [Mesorhizobium sp. WSM4307]|uniref:hypothetical protein n=1 Tax=unclassified Mesorhizobium TaxID=325217 RepID=UPI000BB03FF0|nr:MULTISPECIES: hypothetical protein [unclassified Mesorhizobium]PBC20180.1 hypothetical protein CK226_25935 [Mesorhizobium sp. WSM4311]TRC78012.1 hypothetical protein FJV81_10505 [Mesorhizobium sp. WSM4315]TRC78590.1 hypothetical protein FJV83_29395 [Mesorhizobium sp. WSM4307]TRC80217.1 hypothetical protein FJV80_22915 [Mesorhizobium sp. WSM4310]TRC97287.1 hypothetical protein FJV82_25755 [Mesorhizobium sp. WSM4305]
MHDLIEFFQTNAALVIANPMAFLTFAILFGTGGFIVGRYFLTERVANLESRIARRDDEIEALKTPKGRPAELSFIPIVGTSAIGENRTTPLLGKWPDRRRPGALSAPPHQRRG